MFTDLKIDNFRLFEHFEINDLGRVNLFAGKNNCGKTALLEALRIAAAGTDLSVMHYILQQRGETANNYWNIYDSFFHRKSFEKMKANSNEPLIFKVNNFVFERKYQGEQRNVQYFVTTQPGNKEHISKLTNNLPQPLFPRDKFVYVPFSASDHFPLGFYWDQIALTPKEDIVIRILKETILPDLVRLDVQQNDRIMVRLKDEERPVPLKNLGDGAQRVFTMALALVSAKNNVLLIDEIETGLHYSVIEEIWNIIFNYSAELDVQVFATTHSQDAIKTFGYVLEKPKNEKEGVYFRLQANSQTGLIEAIRYELENLELSLESNLDPR